MILNHVSIFQKEALLQIGKTIMINQILLILAISVSHSVLQIRLIKLFSYIIELSAIHITTDITSFVHCCRRNLRFLHNAKVIKFRENIEVK